MESTSGTVAQTPEDLTEGQVPEGGAGAPPSPPSPPAVVSPTPTDTQTPELRNRLAAQGRELADARRELANMQQQLGSVVTSINEDRYKTYLESLSPEQRDHAELEHVKDELRQLKDGYQAPNQSRQPTQDEMVAYAQRRSQELLDYANGLLADGSTIRFEDIPQYARTDETSFTTALRVLVDQRNAAASRQPKQEEAVAGKKNDEAVTLTPDQIQKMVEEGVAKALQGTGVGRPGGPRPAAGTQTDEPFDMNQLVLDAQTNRNGTAGIRKAAAEARQRMGSGKGR